MAAQTLPQASDTLTDPTAVISDTGTRRFSELPAFERHQPGASPWLAQAWADSIVQFWQLQRDAGLITPSQPLYLFDPAPGDGSLAWLLLQALERSLSGHARELIPCYVACHREQDRLDWLAQHPWLQAYRQQGWFDTALQADDGSAGLNLRAQDITLLRTANPLVLLGWQWLSNLTSELVAAEQGQLWDGMVSLQSSDGSLDYDWQPVDAATWKALPHQHLLQDCIDNTASVPVLIPTDACRAIDYFSAMSEGGYLFLSADEGQCTLQQLRLQSVPLPAAWSPADAQPAVNYHALSVHQQSRQAWTWNDQACDHGMVLHVACRVDQEIFQRHDLTAILAPLAGAHPDQARQLVARASPERTPDAFDLLGLLKLSGYHPAVLQAGIDTILEQTAQLNNTARRSWHVALMHIWNNYLPAASDAAFLSAFGMLAARLGHWGLAKDAFHAKLTLCGWTLDGLHNLAYCQAATGQTSQALSVLSCALEADPGDATCLALQERLLMQQQRHEALPWYHAELASEEELTLEPLSQQHADSLLYQNRDSQIGIMTNLPELKTQEQASQFIARENANDGRHSYAVMHACWGFIGVVSLQRGEDAGYFHFWIGTDFQDQGWGQKAARLLWRQAEKNGIAELFSAVYQDNARSRHALARLGFTELSIRAQPPKDDMIFVHRPLASYNQTACAGSTAAELAERLRVLCARIDYSVEFFIDKE
jgi:RimJ/RimL family protein N-acetyltransferase